jgi:uncharacterized protein (TIGR02597 family)
MKALPLPVSALIFVTFAGGLSLRAEDVTTSEIHGFVRFTAPAYTDTPVSPAFGRPAVWVGAVSSVESNRFRLSAATGWTDGQFVMGGAQTNTYYVRLLSGDNRGHYFTIAGNDSSSLLLDNAGIDLTASVHTGDRFEIAPYWTLGTFYPASQANLSFIPSPSPLARQTEVSFYDPAGIGAPRSTTQSFYYYNGAWRKLGQPETDSYDNVVLLPDAYFLHRNKGTATSLVENGRVFGGAVASFVAGQPTGAQDNFAAIAYPLPVTLRQTGLVASGAFSSSPSEAEITDKLLVFKPDQIGYNHIVAATYYYANGGWRKQGAPSDVDYSDTATVPGAHGFVIRKALASSTQPWVFETGL